jgi:hypothetical protein
VVAVDEVLVRVLALAQEQQSTVELAQMKACGASRTWVARRVSEGVIVREGPSAYRVAGVRRTFETRAMAAVLSARAPALVSHRSAAYLHGFERMAQPGRVDITVPRHRRPRTRTGVTVHESRAFELAGATVLHRIPATGVARTILDCSPIVPAPIRLLDEALRRRMVTWDDLWGCYLDHNVAGRREVVPFRRILLERDGNTPAGGDFARIMATVLKSAGLPQPTFEHRVIVNGHEYYLDLAWPHRMVAVECNDAGSHDTPKAFRRDPMKRNRCEAIGWRYLEFTWWDLVRNTAEVVAQVTAALGPLAA